MAQQRPQRIRRARPDRSRRSCRSRPATHLLRTPETQPYTFTVLDGLRRVARAPDGARRPSRSPRATWATSPGIRPAARRSWTADSTPGLEYTVRSRVIVPTAEQLEQRPQPRRPCSTGNGPASPARTSSIHGSSSSRRRGRRRRLGLREGARDPAALPQRRVPVQHGRRRGRRPGRLAHVPHADQGRLLPAVRHGDGGAGPRARDCPRGSPSATRPARSRTTAGTWSRATSAHAWVEVYFEGYGWLQFEPTPGHGTHPNADPGTYLNPAKSSANPGALPGRDRIDRQHRRRPAPICDRGGRPLAGSDSSCARSRTGPSGVRATSSRCHRSGPPRPTGRVFGARTG